MQIHDDGGICFARTNEVQVLSRDIVNISVQVEGRDDGGIRVTSRDEAGLLLSHSDPAWLWPKVGPTLKGLLEANKGYEIAAVDYPQAYPEGRGPHDVDFTVATFVVHLRRAA